jgi:hypothetical protein
MSCESLVAAHSQTTRALHLKNLSTSRLTSLVVHLETVTTTSIKHLDTSLPAHLTGIVSLRRIGKPNIPAACPQNPHVPSGLRTGDRDLSLDKPYILRYLSTCDLVLYFILLSYHSAACASSDKP